MIKERYVSPEVAKLLKEKGFNEYCYTYYDVNGTLNRFDKGYDFNNTSYPWGIPYDVSKAKKYIVAPTQQMACDWMQTKNVLITYDLAGPFGSKLVVKVYRKDYDLDWVEAITIIRDNLKTAINDALEYALKNLL